MAGIEFGGLVRGKKKGLHGGRDLGGLLPPLAGQGNGPDIGVGGGGPGTRQDIGLRNVQEALSRAGGLVRQVPTGWGAGWVSGLKIGCRGRRVLEQGGSLLQQQVWPAGVLPGCGLGFKAAQANGWRKTYKAGSSGPRRRRGIDGT